MSEQTIREKLIGICTDLVKGCKEQFCTNCKYNDNAYPRCRGIYMADRIIEELEREQK